MPWLPELFTAPALQHLREKRRRGSFVTVPYFDGVLAGEPDALIESFAGEPEVYDPVRGRVKGVPAFQDLVADTSGWLQEHHVRVEDVERLITERRGFGEVVLHLDGDSGPVELPVVVVSDRASDGRIEELRIYSSRWPLTRRHMHRQPLLQQDSQLDRSAVVLDYRRALAAGDVDALVATFAADGYVRASEAVRYDQHGPDRLRDFYRQLLSDRGGMTMELCSMVDDGRLCLLEYNVVAWGEDQQLPQAGAAVFVRGRGDKLSAVRLYDDVAPPAPGVAGG